MKQTCGLEMSPRRVYAFNCVYTLFIFLVAFWSGMLIGMYYTVSVAVNFALLSNIAVSIVGVGGLCFLITMPVTVEPDPFSLCSAGVTATPPSEEGNRETNCI